MVQEMRWFGLILMAAAWITLLVSFFLPAATPLSFGWAAPLQVLTGWETFLEALNLPRVVGFSPLAMLALGAPAINALVLAGPAAILALRHYAAAYGALVCICGGLAAWLCPMIYDDLRIGYYLWIGSIFAIAAAAFLIGMSHAREQSLAHDRRLAELQKVQAALEQA